MLRAAREITEPKRTELEDKARATVAQFLGSVGLIATVAVALYSVNQARIAADQSVEQARDAAAQTLAANERANASDRFSHAVDQLGADTPRGKRDDETRLGAIYTLQQYATSYVGTRSEGQDAVQTTAGVLAAYVRTNSQWNPSRRPMRCAPHIPLRDDVIAAVLNEA
jgi:hypothetical protein